MLLLASHASNKHLLRLATSDSAGNMSCCALQQAIWGAIWAVAPCNNQFGGQYELLRLATNDSGVNMSCCALQQSIRGSIWAVTSLRRPVRGLTIACFWEKQLFGGWQSHVFEKNARSGGDNRMFLRKTVVRGLTIACFWEKQSFGGWQSHVFEKNSCSGKMSYCIVAAAIRQTKKSGQQTFACWPPAYI